MTKLLRSTLLICLAALLIAGCGDSEPTLTKAEFIKRGDAICAKSEKEKQSGLEAFLLKSGSGPLKGLSRKQEVTMATDYVAPPIRKAAEELDDLGAPEGSEAKVDAIVNGVEKALTEMEERAGKPKKPTDDPFAGVAAKAGKFGFKVCFINY